MQNQFTEDQATWLSDLEGGHYSQGGGSLWWEIDGKRLFCCLGVAADRICPEDPEMSGDKGSRGVLAPVEVVERLHLRSRNGELHPDAPRTLGRDANALAGANDGGATFAEIAAYIRKYPWAVFTNFDAHDGGSK